ncbi:hypothetical protein [Tsukamurella paurometabola]
MQGLDVDRGGGAGGLIDRAGGGEADGRDLDVGSGGQSVPDDARDPLRQFRGRGLAAVGARRRVSSITAPSGVTSAAATLVPPRSTASTVIART